MKCPKCGHENPPDAVLCVKCQAVRFVRAAKPGGASVPGAPRPAPTPAARPAPAGPRHYLARAGAPPLDLVPGKAFTIGRAPECSFSVPSKRVSRLHAEIRWDGDKPVLADKDSANGVFVNGKRVKEAALQVGDELEIGPFLCVYQFGDPAAAKPDTGEVSKTMADKGDVLGGQITDAGLAEVLQSLEFNAKTGTLSVFARDVSGWLTIVAGSPGAAEANEKTDEEAVIELLMLKAGRFTFSSELRSSEKRIKTTVTGLLLEWGRRADERQSAAAAMDAPTDVGMNLAAPSEETRPLGSTRSDEGGAETQRLNGEGFEFP